MRKIRLLILLALLEHIKNLSVDDITDIAVQVMKQNKHKLQKIGMNGTGQVEGVVNGVKYVLGVNKGRVGQLFPK